MIPLDLVSLSLLNDVFRVEILPLWSRKAQASLKILDTSCMKKFSA